MKGTSQVDFTLKWFYRIWFSLVIGLNIIGIIGMYLSTSSFIETWEWVQQTYSPYNLWNLVLNLILLSPGYGVYVWRNQRLKNLSDKQNHE